MRFFLSKKKLISQFAQELAFLQIRADWWHYISTEPTHLDSVANRLDQISELRFLCQELNILSEVYEEAYKIYDFRDSGKSYFNCDKELVIKLNKEFCKPIMDRRYGKPEGENNEY